MLDAIVRRNKELSPRVFEKMTREEILLRLGVVARAEVQSERYVPTLAGLLVAGIYPQQFFPRLNITFTVYPGITKAQKPGQSFRYTSSQAVNGSIPEMLLTSLELIDKNMNKGALIESALRKEVTDYPLAACREAIINALQHRDYSPEGMGSQVQINMFADRLEILNPGGFYGAASFTSLPIGISSTRNMALSQLLEYTPFEDEDGKPGYVIENRGTGLQQIKEELHNALMPQADIRDYVSAFQITFRKRRLTETEQYNDRWENFDAALIDELKNNSSLSVNEIIASSGLSRNTVSVRLKKLKEKGIIEPIEKPKSPKQRYRLVQTNDSKL